MVSSSSRPQKSPQELAAELKQKLTPEEWVEKLKEQLSLAEQCQAPPMSGFKIVGPTNERTDQIRPSSRRRSIREIKIKFLMMLQALLGQWSLQKM